MKWAEAKLREEEQRALKYLETSTGLPVNVPVNGPAATATSASAISSSVQVISPDFFPKFWSVSEFRPHLCVSSFYIRRRYTFPDFAPLAAVALRVGQKDMKTERKQTKNKQKQN